MPRIIIENTSFNKEELKMPDRGAWSGFSENSRAALQFCREWLSGNQSFELKTSGSVGKPKSIVLSRDQIMLSIRMSAGALGLDKNNSTIICLPANYIAGLMMLARVLELDMNAQLLEPSGNPLSSLEEDHAFGFISVVPLQLTQVLATEAGRRKLNRFKIVLVGGAPLNAELEKEIRDLAPAVYHTYGMTETASHIALRRLDGEYHSEYFSPLEGIDIGLDERGCLMVRGGVTGGVFIVTNDLAEIHENKFRILGRIDNTVNTGGVKVQVEKVEQEIAAVPGNSSRFFVSSVPDKVLGEKLIVVFEGRDITEDFKEELLGTLRKKLSKFETPTAIFTVPRFVYTLSGKINRNETLALLKNS